MPIASIAPYLLLSALLLVLDTQPARAAGYLGAVPHATASPSLLQLADSRYSGRSGGSRGIAPMSRGLSDSQVGGGGYGFTRKSHFRNSENNRSQFRNGASIHSDFGRSDFGHRYDRNSKLKPLYDASPAARALPPGPRLSIEQPAARFGPSRKAGAAAFEYGSRAVPQVVPRATYPGFAAGLRAKEALRKGGPPKPYRGLHGAIDR